MANITAAQAAELARIFLGLAQSIGNYRFANWKKLSRAENEELAGRQWSVLNAGEDMLALSTTLQINEAADTIKQLKKVTEDVNDAILKIQRVQQVVNIAAAVISLAAVIIGKQPLAVPGAINELVNAIKVKI